jgi:hypothetical protein
MTAGVFASVDAPPVGLMEGIARIFETLERMTPQDQTTVVAWFGNPDDEENEIYRREQMALERLAQRRRGRLTSVK